MASKLEKLKEKAKELGIDLDANETISDLEAKIAFAEQKTETKKENKQPKAPRRGRVIKNKTFTTRLSREAKDNG